MNGTALAMLFALTGFAAPAENPYILQRTTIIQTTDATGKIIDERRLIETEMRASNGNRMTRRDAGTYSLFVAPERATYTIDERGRRAVKRHQAPPSGRASTPEERMARSTRAKGTKTIAGLTCHVFPVISVNAPGTEGRICQSLEQNIVLERTRISHGPDGRTTEAIDTVTDLQLGVEPDPAQMTGPSGFEMVDRSGAAGSECASCPKPDR